MVTFCNIASFLPVHTPKVSLHYQEIVESDYVVWFHFGLLPVQLPSEKPTNQRPLPELLTVSQAEERLTTESFITSQTQTEAIGTARAAVDRGRSLIVKSGRRQLARNGFREMANAKLLRIVTGMRKGVAEVVDFC
jgi:hypothetical protein